MQALGAIDPSFGTVVTAGSRVMALNGVVQAIADLPSGHLFAGNLGVPRGLAAFLPSKYVGFDFVAGTRLTEEMEEDARPAAFTLGESSPSGDNGDLSLGNVFIVAVGVAIAFRGERIVRGKKRTQNLNGSSGGDSRETRRAIDPENNNRPGYRAWDRSVAGVTALPVIRGSSPWPSHRSA